MTAWQLVLMFVFVLVPLVLLSVFHRDRERLSARGKPLPRDWTPRGSQAIEEDHY